jgi:hypothetical protein
VILQINNPQVPATVRPILERLVKGGFNEKETQYVLSPNDQRVHQISTDDLHLLLQTGMSVTAGGPGKEDWVMAGILHTFGIHSTREGDVLQFVLNFQLV